MSGIAGIFALLMATAGKVDPVKLRRIRNDLYGCGSSGWCISLRRCPHNLDASFGATERAELPPKFRLPRLTYDDVTLEGRAMKIPKQAYTTLFKELAAK